MSTALWGKGSLLSVPLPSDSLGAALGAMLSMLFLGRPHHRRRVGPVASARLLPRRDRAERLGLCPFVGSVCLSLIVTPLFIASSGCILWPALFPFQVNSPLWPDAQSCESCFFAGVAVLVVWIRRRTMLTRDGAVTEDFAPHNQTRSSP